MKLSKGIKDCIMRNSAEEYKYMWMESQKKQKNLHIKN